MFCPVLQQLLYLLRCRRVPADAPLPSQASLQKFVHRTRRTARNWPAVDSHATFTPLIQQQSSAAFHLSSAPSVAHYQALQAATSGNLDAALTLAVDAVAGLVPFQAHDKLTENCLITAATLMLTAYNALVQGSETMQRRDLPLFWFLREARVLIRAAQSEVLSQSVLCVTVVAVA